MSRFDLIASSPRVERYICRLVESASANDRRQQAVTFTLNSDQISKLKYNRYTYLCQLSVPRLLICTVRDTNSVFSAPPLCFTPPE